MKRLKYMNRAAAILVSILSACTNFDPVAPERPLPDIRDGAHGGGNGHFFWLPPVVDDVPATTGVFDAGRHPTLTIVIRGGGQRKATEVYTMSSGISVDLAVPRYQLVWHPPQVLEVNDTVTVTASEGPIVLGFFDAIVYSNRQGECQKLRNATDDTWLEICENGNLRIYFRIENGAVPDIEAGLLAYYPLAGSAADATGNGWDGRIEGNPRDTTADRFGALGTALDFDGDGDKVVLPGATTARAAGTLSLWIKVRTTTSAACGRPDLGNATPFYCDYSIFTKQEGGGFATPRFRAQLNGPAFGSNPWDSFYFSVDYESPAGVAPTSAAALLEWHLYTFVWTSTRKQVFIDDLQVLDMPGAFATPGSGDLYLGDNASNLVEYELLNGSLDDLRVYDRALTGLDVAWLYHLTRAVP